MRVPIYVPHYAVSQTAAVALERLRHLQAREVSLSVDNLIKLARFNADEAHELLLTDAGTARDYLLTGASRMIRAAEQLEAQFSPRDNIAPIRAVR